MKATALRCARLAYVQGVAGRAHCADRIGFAPMQVDLVLEAAGDTTVVLRLELMTIETEGIVVTSGRTERRIEEEPIRIEAVTREEVEEKLLMTPGDIAMLLNETAGLRVQPTAPSLGGASVRIQGLRGRYTQILTDGMPLYGGQAGAQAGVARDSRHREQTKAMRAMMGRHVIG